MTRALRRRSYCLLKRTAPAILAVVYVMAVVSHLALAGGVPAFQQDWLWPIDRAQLPGFANLGLSAWLPSGAGSPLVYPEAWWWTLLAAAFCYVFGMQFGLVAFLCFWLSAGALGIAAAARVCRLSPLAGAVAVCAFIGNPVVLNALQAGHLTFIMGYALLPWIFALSRSASTFAASGVAGAVLGLSVVQQQFLPLGAVLMLASWRYRDGGLGRAVVAIAVAALVSASSWLPAVAGGVTSLNVYAPVLHWEMAQSASIGDAMRMLGYIGGYDGRMLNDVQRTLLWSFPIVAAVGVARARTIEAGVLAATCVVAWTVASGLNGPLAPVLAALFQSFPQSGFFRELYNVQAFAALGVSLLAGYAVTSPLTVRGQWVARGVAVTAIAITLPIAWTASQTIPRVTNAMVAPLLSQLADGSHGYRYITIPATFPQAAAALGPGGLSPLIFAVGETPSALSALVDSPTALWASVAESGPLDDNAATLLSRGGIGSLVSLPGIDSSIARNIEPAFHILVRAAPPYANHSRRIANGERLAVEPFSAQPGTAATSYAGARDVRPFQTLSAVDVQLLSSQPDPRLGWARTGFWPTLPQWVYREPANVFTLEPTIAAKIPAAYVVAGDRSGTLASATCRSWLRLDDRWQVLQCAANPIFHGRPPIAIATVATRIVPMTIQRQRGGFGQVRIRRQTPTSIEADVSVPAGSALVLRERYDDRWVADLATARHVEVDGYANAWVFDSPFRGRIDIQFTGALVRWVAIWISAITLIAVGIATRVERRGRIGRTAHRNA